MKTNIATTASQSQRLLRCGVSADTADMFYQTPMTVSQKATKEDILLVKNAGKTLFDTDTPAWSLSALLGLLPKEIKVDESPYDEVQKYGLLIYPFMGGWQVDYQYCEDDECHCLKCVHGTDPIEACVKAIEWLSANGYKLNDVNSMNYKDEKP